MENRIVEGREVAQEILNDLRAGSRSQDPRGTELGEVAGIVAALLYVGDQLAYLNKTMDGIQANTRFVGGNR